MDLKAAFASALSQRAPPFMGGEQAAFHHGIDTTVKRAIISDIHGNLEAFSAVLAEIERRGVQHVVCLGDIVGYGPNKRVTRTDRNI